MAYFLKKTVNKKGTYLQIYESFYDPSKKDTSQKAYKPLGYLHDLIASGIEDPISYYKEEILRLNQERKSEKITKSQVRITNDGANKNLGYFPIKNINDGLGVKGDIDLMQSNMSSFNFNLYSMISDLIYARIVLPCSKIKTFEEVLPRLFENTDYTLGNLYSGLEFIGSEYERIIEIYNHHIQKKYPFNTSRTYFDCTNFYFEIDRESEICRKGPSKENRKSPIVGYGLLLDANQIPFAMNVFPGNESEKPVFRNIIETMKKRYCITGRTIRVADKGLNCAQNIITAINEGDGYIFSKSIRTSDTDLKKTALDNNGYINVLAKDGSIVYSYKETIEDLTYKYEDETGNLISKKVKEKRLITFSPKLAKKQNYEIDRLVEKARKATAYQAKKSDFGTSAKFIKLETEKGDKIKAVLDEKRINEARELAGYNILVTSEILMKAEDVYNIYHNLWRIEESFKIMKSQLDARPVYLQKKETIIGHFLICYLAILLERIFQFKVLNNEYCTEEIFDFMKNFTVMKLNGNQFVNSSRLTEFLEVLEKKTSLPLGAYYLSEGHINDILNYRFK